MPEEFYGLDEQGQVALLRELGETALREFGVVPEAMEPLVHAENTTFRVTSEGETFCLRIHRPGYRTTEAVRSELMWLHALRSDAGLEVPEPMPSPDGAGVVIVGHARVPEVRNCVLFRWLEGEFHKGPATSDADLRLLGHAMARLHEHARRWTPPAGFVRERLDDLTDEERERRKLFDGGRTFLQGEDAAYVAAALDAGSAAALALGRDPDSYGLIHADLHLGNLLFHPEGLRVIDFDDSGYGHFAADFAAALAYLTAREDYPALRAALLEAYAEVRPLPPSTEDVLDDLIRLRLAGVCHWLATRIDNPWCREEGPAIAADLLRMARALPPR